MKTKSVSRFEVREYRNPGGKVAYVVAGYRASGARVRKRFKDRLKAQNYAYELEFESTGVPLSDAKIYREVPAFVTGDDLNEAVSALKLLRAQGAKAGLLTVTRYWLETYHAGACKKLSDAVTEFLSEKAARGLRPRALSNLKHRLGHFSRAHPEAEVANIRADDIRRAVYVTGWKPYSCDGMRRALHNFFNWAYRRDYARENPVAKVDAPRVRRGLPQILSVEETKALLRAALAHGDDSLTCYLALCLFAGLRPSEAAAMKWSDIDLDEKRLTVRPENCKTGRPRLVQLPDNLITWLRPHQGEVAVEAGRRSFDRVRILAGFRASRTSRDDEDRRAWTADVMRHSALSYRLAVVQDAGKVALWAGNSVQILLSHYATGLVRESDSKEYWSLTPDSIAVVNFPLAVNF